MAEPVVLVITAKDINASQILQQVRKSLDETAQQAVRAGRNASKGIERITQSFDELKIRTSELTRNLFNVKNAILGGLVGGAISQLSKIVLQNSAELEGYKAQFEALTHSTELAQQKLQSLIEFAAATPFETRSVIEAASMMEALGLQSEKLVKTLGNVAAAFNRDIIEAAYAMQAAFSGESEVLKRWGIQMRQTGEQVTFTFRNAMGEIQTIVAQNTPQIRAKILETIWNETYSGAMEKYSSTWKGMVSLLKSYWWEFTTAIGESGFFDWLKEQLEKVVSWVNEAREAGKFDEWARQISEALKSAGKVFISLGRFVIDAARTLWRFKDAIIAIAVAITAYRLTTQIIGVVNAVKNLTTAIWAAKGAITAITSTTVIGAIVALVSALGSLALVKKQLSEQKGPLLDVDAILQASKGLAGTYEEQLRKLRELKRLLQEVHDIRRKRREGRLTTTEYYELSEAAKRAADRIKEITGEEVKLDAATGKLTIGNKLWAKAIHDTNLAIKATISKLKELKTETQSHANTHRTIANTVKTLSRKQIAAILQEKAALQQVKHELLEIQEVPPPEIDSWTIFTSYLQLQFEQLKASSQDFAAAIAETFNTLSSSMANSIDTAIFEKSFMEETEQLQEQIETQERLIEELEQKREEAILRGDETTANSIQKQIDEHRRFKGELERQLEEIKERHESTYSQIFRQFRQKFINLMIRSINVDLIQGAISKIGPAWKTIVNTFTSTTSSILSAIWRVISALGSQTIAVLANAAAWIYKTGARVAESLAEALGPLAIAAIPAAIAGLVATFKWFKSALKFAKGGLVPMLAGGLVAGPAWPKDTIPALLTGGEYVIRREVVERVGISTLEAINRYGQIPNQTINYQIEVHFHNVRPEDTDLLEEWAKRNLPSIIEELKVQRKIT